MEKYNFIKEGRIRLPPGFRFQPTDEELVFQYLKCKVLSWPLPASIIPEINVCKYDPWDLPGDMEQERYFFSNKESKYPNGKQINRATPSGYWKATGVDKHIICSRKNNHVVGMRKTLVFYRGKPPNGTRTDLIMHEFRLASSGNFVACNFPRTKTSFQNLSNDRLENWVLCRIHMKKRNTTKLVHSHTTPTSSNIMLENINVSIINPQLRTFLDFLNRDKVASGPATSSSSSSSSSSSGITIELSNLSEADHEKEESSA